MDPVYADFLKMLEISDAELPALLPKWKNTADRVGLTPDDIRTAMNDWIPRHWDISLRGVRLCIGAYIREMIDVTDVDSRRESGIGVVYGISPSHPVAYQAIKMHGGDSVFVGYPDFVLTITLGSLFNKLSWFHQDSYFDEKCGHCSLNRTRLNAVMRGVISVPDIIWSWGMYCDEGPKTDEMMECVTEKRWNYITSRLPHDVECYTREDEDESRVAYLAEQMRDAHRLINEATGLNVGEADMRAALAVTGEYTARLDSLLRMSANGNPQPIGGNEIALFGTTSNIVFNTGLGYVIEAIDCMAKEVQARIDAGTGILPKDAPRLGCYFTPFNVPWVDRAFLEKGVGIAFSSQNCLSRLQMQDSDYDDPYKDVAQRWLRNPNSVNVGYQAELMSRLIGEYSVDGMLYGFLSFDRWLGGNQQMMVRMVEDMTKMQCFYIEGDFWNEKDFTPEDRASRIESTASILKIQKLMSGAYSKPD